MSVAACVCVLFIVSVMSPGNICVIMYIRSVAFSARAACIRLTNMHWITTIRYSSNFGFKVRVIPLTFLKHLQFTHLKSRSQNHFGGCLQSLCNEKGSRLFILGVKYTGATYSRRKEAMLNNYSQINSYYHQQY